ncbi:MAG: oligosaccharide flippase family protein [Lachnospiraceae bacterium]|nr:oligosaccharide flippase family protein [Lachnospiraceae bacterium]
MKFVSKWDSVPQAAKISIAFTICGILQRCLTFITLPLFTRLLTPTQYGQLTIYCSWTGILSLLLTLNLAYGSFSTAMVKYEDRRDAYISSIQGICLVLTALFLVIYLPLRKYFNALFELPTFLMLVMVLEVLAATSIQLWSGKKRFEFKYKSVVAQVLLASLLSPILAYILVCSTEEKGYARILGYSSVTILIGGFLFILNLIKGKKLYCREFWKYAFRFNIPLLAFFLSQTIFNQSDRIMISHISGTDKAAMYGVAYNLAMMLMFVIDAINTSYVPWFYGKIKEQKQKDNQVISLMLAGMMALLLLAVIWYAPEIILIMAGSQYQDAIWVVAPVSMSLLLLFYAQLFINVAFYYEEKKALVGASIGAALVNIVLNALLIPVCGFVAAGYTTLLSYLIFAFANCQAMRKILRERNIEDTAYNYRLLLLILAGFMAAGFLGVALYGHLISRILITLIVLVILLLNAKRVITMFQSMRG